MKSLTVRILLFAAAALSLLLSGCSSTRHVPDGEYLLDKVNIDVVNSPEVSTSGLANYLRQSPNHKVLGF